MNAVTLIEAGSTVKTLITLAAKPIFTGDGTALDTIRALQAALDAVEKLPKLEARSYPYYADIDGGQTGVVIAAHLTEGELAAIPAHIANEVLDDLTTDAAAVPFWSQIEPAKKREMLLAGYGPALAELVCQAIDEALKSRGEGHKRYVNYAGKKRAPLSSNDLDEPYFEDCGPDDQHSTPTTEFDFMEAIEAARELIETRDKAAKLVRRGESVPA